MMKKHALIPFLASALLMLAGCSFKAEISISTADKTASQVSETSQTVSPSSAESQPSSEPTSSTGYEPASTSEPSSSATSEQTSVSSSQSSSQSSSASSSQSSSQESSSSSSASMTSSSSSASKDNPWDGISMDQYGEQMMASLRSRINDLYTKTTSYTDCLSVGAKAAAYPNENSSTFIPFYHEAKDSEKTTTSACNREHVWPNSRGSGKSGPGADPFIIRPTLTSENSDRGNDMYSLASEGGWDPASCGFEGARGESARVILYAAVRYSKSHGLSLTNNVGDATSNKTMGKLIRLLEWNRNYEPTAMEMQINNYLAAKGYGRNPFVDNPSFADRIWDDNGIRTSGEGGGVTPVGPKYTYSPVTAENLDGKDVVISLTDESATTVHYAMSDEAISEAYPWYLKGTTIVINEEGKLETDSELTFFHFAKQPEGGYVITSKKSGTALFAYTDGSHNSICMGTPSNATKSSTVWNVNSVSGGYQLCSPLDDSLSIYLEYYRGSACGYKGAPKGPIQFFA